jgi:hypothetical protein
MRMATWKKALVVALAAFAQVSVAQAVSVQEVPVTLPQGDELSDAELLNVDGEAGPLTWMAAGILTAGIGAGVDLLTQGIQIARGKQSGVNWEQVGLVAGVSLVVLTPFNLGLPGTIVRYARWTGRAIADVGAAVGAAAVAAAEKTGSAIVSFAHQAHVALHNYAHQAHVALHNYVSKPVGDAFRSAWDWLTGRR